MKNALKVIISVAVLALVFWFSDAQAVIGRLQGASVSWLILSGLSFTGLTFLMARRWQIIAGAFEIEISYPHAVREYYIAQMVNLVLPGGVVGDVARAVRVRHAGDMLRAGQSVAAERIIGQVFIFAVLGLALIVSLILPGGIAWPALSWIGIGIGIVAAFSALVSSGRAGAAARFMHHVLRLLARPSVANLSLFITVLLVFSLYACARATGTVIPPAGWLTLIPMILSAMLVPLSIGGWGWREGAAAALFPLIGATPEAGIATGIAYGAMMMVAASPGFYFALRTNPPPPSSSTSQVETP